MALINCPECGNQVSERAQACPHCGYNVSSFTQNVERQKLIKKDEVILLISHRVIPGEFGGSSTSRYRVYLVTGQKKGFLGPKDITEQIMIYHNDEPYKEIIADTNKRCYLKIDKPSTILLYEYSESPYPSVLKGTVIPGHIYEPFLHELKEESIYSLDRYF